MGQLFVFAVSGAITLAIQLAGFAVSFALQTEVFYDILGGVNSLVLAGFSAYWGAGQGSISDSKRYLSTLLFVLSRGWLLAFLAWRAHDRKGDARFDGVTDKFGKFLTFWMVQGMWVTIIALPVLFINSSPVTGSWSTAELALAGGFAFGILIEVLADVQKACWVARGRPGTFCQDGVWGFSRHPNYFGEILQWWCAWGLAYSCAPLKLLDWLWWLCILSPVFTMHILLNLPPTGICNAEGKNLKRYYDVRPKEYAQYRESTSVLIPMIGYQHVPAILKRTLFFDFPKYEYRPSKAE